MKEQWAEIPPGNWTPQDILMPPAGYRWVKAQGWEQDLAYAPYRKPDSADVGVNSQGSIWNTLVTLGDSVVSVHDFRVRSQFHSGHQPITLTLRTDHLDVSDPHALVHLRDHAARKLGTLCQSVRVLYSEDNWEVWTPSGMMEYCTDIAIDGDANAGKLKVQITLDAGRPLAEVVYA